MNLAKALDGSSPLDVGQCATLACLLEVIVPKPGNVHRGADFADLTFADFATAAVAIGPAMQRAALGAPIGQAVYDAVAATRQFSATNVNLGIVLLFAPLAAATTAGRSPDALRKGLRNVLAGLNPEDAVRASINRMRSATGTGSSGWRPSRGPTSRIWTRGGSPAFYWRRWSPDPLEHANFHAEVVTVDSPSPLTSGRACVLLDPAGKLVGFQAIPPDSVEARPGGKPDWNVFFAAAGLDSTLFTRITPAPPM